MSDILENEVAAKNPELYEEIKAWLIDHGVNEIDAAKSATLIAAFAVNFGEVISNVAADSTALKIVVGKTTIITDSVMNYAEDPNPAKAIAMALASYFVGNAASGIVASIAAGMGAGTLAIVGAGIVAGFSAALTMDYLVDETWDVLIGPTVKMVIDEDTGQYEFTIYGELSSFLRPRDSFLADLGWAANVWEQYDLANASYWKVESTEDNLIIKYVNTADENIYYFDGVSCSDLKSLYETSSEYKDTIVLILQNHARDFQVVVNGNTTHDIYNYAYWTAEELQDEALNGSEEERVRVVSSLVNLVPFYEESDNYQVVDPEGYSDSYLQDRADFLYYLFTENATSDEDSPIYYIDTATGTSIMVGERETLLDFAQYIFSDDEGRYISAMDNDDHIYGMGGDDTIYAKGGDDYIEGGVGDDTLYGGEGADTYFYNPGSGQDTITDTENSDADTNHITVGNLDLLNTAIESYYSNSSQTLYTFIDSTNGLTYAWNPLTETVLITGSLLDGATTGTTNSISINDISNPNQLFERFGINLTFCFEAALALNTTNPFTLQNYIADDLSATLAEWGSLSFSLGVNQALSAGDKIVIQVSGNVDGSQLTLVYEGQQLDFVNGEITLDAVDGQTLFSFALLEQGELSADGNIAVTATVITVDADGNEMDYAVLNTLNLTVEDDGFTTATEAPQTSRDILGDLSPIDADPEQAGIQYGYDDLGNVVTDPDTPLSRDDTLLFDWCRFKVNTNKKALFHCNHQRC